MRSKILLYQAALSGAYGNRLEFSLGSVTDALFVYLDGAPDKESAAAVDKDFRDRALVCLTGEWEAHVKTTYPEAKVFIRDVMKPLEKFYTCGTMLPGATGRRFLMRLYLRCIHLVMVRIMRRTRNS